LNINTFLQGSTLLSLICAHDYDPLPGEDHPAGDENGRTPVEKQLEALHALFKASVQVNQAISSDRQRNHLPMTCKDHCVTCMIGFVNSYSWKKWQNRLQQWMGEYRMN